MPTTFRGTKAPLLQWFESNFDPSSGFTYNSEYVGHDYDRMQALSNSFTAVGVTASLRFDKGVATLRLSDATGTVVIDKWEVDVDEERPSIFENPIFLNTISGAANRSLLLTKMRNALQNGDPLNNSWDALLAEKSDSTTTPPTVSFTDAAAGVNLAVLKQYFDDYNLGVTNFIRGKYRLVHTTNAPARWNANISEFNVERAYTIAQLLIEAQNQTLWVLPLPGFLAFKILNYYTTALGSPVRNNYSFGALKLRSNACTAAYNRVEIRTEYIIDQVNTNLYPFI